MKRVFLDANVIAKPVTRTLLMVGGAPSGFRALWSRAAEEEATVHMRPRAVAPALVRERFGFQFTPTGGDGGRFQDTKGADRQILADASAANARFLVTKDVDDCGLHDLTRVGISAVNAAPLNVTQLNARLAQVAAELGISVARAPTLRSSVRHSR